MIYEGVRVVTVLAALYALFVVKDDVMAIAFLMASVMADIALLKIRIGDMS